MDFLDGVSRVGGSAVTATTQFEIGSNTKTFTSALLSYMITQNKISLDDDLQAFAPTGTTVTSANGEQITIADLVTDEGGLPDDPPNLAGDCTAPCTPLQNYTEPLMWDAVTDPIGLTPGANWQYSDFGNGLLGTVLANIYDPHQAAPPYNQALATLVTGPLGMSSTYLERATPQLATGYKYLSGVQTRTKYWDNTGAMAGGGGLISDLDDMTTWVEAQSGFPNADSSFLPQTTSPLADVTSQCTDDLCSPMHTFPDGDGLGNLPRDGSRPRSDQNRRDAWDELGSPGLGRPGRGRSHPGQRGRAREQRNHRACGPPPSGPPPTSACRSEPHSPYNPCDLFRRHLHVAADPSGSEGDRRPEVATVEGHDHPGGRRC